MQTGAISYRVADFLKQHPPYNAMEEADLLTLAARGRVKFHESDEFLCWQGAAYSPYLFVIQQGSVSLWEESNGAEVLRDIRGPGETIGFERYLGSTAHPYSAKTNGDTIVYALQAADFEPLLVQYHQAARYVESHTAAGAVYQDAERHGVHETYVISLVLPHAAASCGRDTLVTEAAERMRASNTDALAVLDGTTLVGLITAADVLDWAARGASHLASVSSVMAPPPPTFAPQTLVSDCILSMSHSARPYAALTADGTPSGELLRLISPADLQPAFGDHPVSLLADIAKAESLDALRLLHLRARAFLLSQLSGPSIIDWLSQVGAAFNAAIVQRTLALTGALTAGRAWCFWSSAGRGELLSPAEPKLMVICHDAADAAPALQAYHQLRGHLAALGYAPHPPSEWDPQGTLAAATLAEWRSRFEEWIRRPIFSRMHEARPLLDLRLAAGSAEPYQNIQSWVAQLLDEEPNFQPVLANDCLASLPPLTFFEDAVVDDSGERAETFALGERALFPIVEVGRVFAISSGKVLGPSTLERLEAARAALPENEKIFRDAMETVRVLLYLQARAGLRTSSSGFDIPPVQLSRLDRQALKSGFRAIHKLLAFTESYPWAAAV